MEKVIDIDKIHAANLTAPTIRDNHFFFGIKRCDSAESAPLFVGGGAGQSSF
jgi:hypothetical protein